MSLAGQEAFAFESLINQQAVDSEFIDFSTYGLTSGDLIYYNDPYLNSVTTGTGLSLTSGILSNTGVTSLTGTANRITVSNSTGNITLSTPQDINTTSSPTFNNLTLNGTLILQQISCLLAADIGGNVLNASTGSSLTYNTTYRTLNTIQDIQTTASPTFAGLTLTGLTGILKATAGTIATNATTDDLTEGSTNLYFTTTRARGAFTAGTNITITSGAISTVTNPIFNSITASNILGLQQTLCLLAADIGGNVLNASTGSSLTYNTTTRTLNTIQDIQTTASPTFAGLTLGTLSGILKATAGTIATNATTDDLTEGSTNLYFTNNRARAAITAAAPIYAISGIISIGYNTSNLKLTLGGNLDTIQDIATSSSPQFARLLNSSIGSTNLLLGSNTGVNLTTGGGNTLIGQGAGSCITTGTYNIGIGPSAFGGLGNMTQNNGFNVAVGVNALYSCSTSAAGNIAIGYQSLANLTTGTTNIQIGNGSVNTLATGSNNVYIGPSISSSSTSVSGEGVINLFGSTAGKGANTMFINASAGLYSYMPAYAHFASSNNTLNLMYWNTTYFNQNISVSNQTVTFALAGLYEISFSGSVRSNVSGFNVTGSLNINGTTYNGFNPTFIISNPTSGNYYPLSVTIIFRMTAGSTMFMTTFGIQGSAVARTYLSIKFISL